MTPFKLPTQNKTGFTVPDTYFDEMREQVNAKIARRDVVWTSRRNWWYAAAAVVVLALGFVFYTANPAKSSVDDNVVENYLVLQATTQDLVVDALDADDIEALYSQYEVPDQIIEEQLMQTNIEPYLIY